MNFHSFWSELCAAFFVWFIADPWTCIIVCRLLANKIIHLHGNMWGEFVQFRPFSSSKYPHCCITVVMFWMNLLPLLPLFDSIISITPENPFLFLHCFLSLIFSPLSILDYLIFIVDVRRRILKKKKEVSIHMWSPNW